MTAIRHVATFPRVFVLLGIIDNADWDPDSLAEAEITWNNAPRNATFGSASEPPQDRFQAKMLEEWIS